MRIRVKNVIRAFILFINGFSVKFIENRVFYYLFFYPLYIYKNVIIIKYGILTFIVQSFLLMLVWGISEVNYEIYYKFIFVACVLVLIRLFFRILLYGFGGKGDSGPVSYLPELHILYKKKKFCNSVMHWLYFRGNIGFFSSNFFVSVSLYKRIVLHFLYLVLKDIYLPLKLKLITGRLLNLLNFRLFVIIIILLLGYPVIPIIVLVLFYKIFKAIWLELSIGTDLVNIKDVQEDRRQLTLLIKGKYNFFSKNLKSNRVKKIKISKMKSDLIKNIWDYDPKKYCKFDNEYLNKLNCVAWIDNLLEIYFVYNKLELKKYKQMMRNYEKKVSTIVGGGASLIIELNDLVNDGEKIKVIFSTDYRFVSICVDLKIVDECVIANILSNPTNITLRSKIDLGYEAFGEFITAMEQFEDIEEKMFSDINYYMTRELSSKYGFKGGQDLPLEVFLWILFGKISKKYFTGVNKEYEIIIRSCPRADEYYEIIYKSLY